jgi:hypothetical protein
MVQQPIVGQGLLIIEASRSHSDTPHSVGLLWTSDQPRRRDLYLTAHNTHKRQTSKLPVGFEPTIPASERPQTHALDRTDKKGSAFSVSNFWYNSVWTKKQQKD